MAAAPTSHPPVVTLDDVARGEFLVRVYQHLLAALLAFLAFEALLFNLGAAESLYDLVAGSGATWLLLLGGFMVVSWLATSAAHDILNPSRQYAGLFGLAAAEALIFAPFLYYVFEVQNDGSSTARLFGSSPLSLSSARSLAARPISLSCPVIANRHATSSKSGQSTVAIIVRLVIRRLRLARMLSMRSA